MHDQRLPLLGDLERDIMRVAWERPWVTVREVEESLRTRRDSAYTTIMTVMNRLVEKGVLRRKQHGQCFQYCATRSKEEYLERTSRQVVARFVEDYGSVAIAQFIDALDDVDPARVAALRKKVRSTHR